jgi:hypothetical protein
MLRDHHLQEGSIRPLSRTVLTKKDARHRDSDRILHGSDSERLLSSHEKHRRLTYQEAPTMAKSSDGSSDDSTASTTNCSVKFRSNSPASKTTKKNLAKAQKTKLYPLKFEYNLKTANVNIAQLHGKVLKALVDAHG